MIFLPKKTRPKLDQIFQIALMMLANHYKHSYFKVAEIQILGLTLRRSMVRVHSGLPLSFFRDHDQAGKLISKFA